MNTTNSTISQNITPESLKELLQNEHYRELVIQLFDTGAQIKDLMEVTEDQVEALYDLVLQFYKAGKYEKAEPLAQLICIVDNTQSRYWRALGAIRQMSGQPEAAIEAYAMAVAREPENPTVLLDMGNTLLAIEDYERARMCLESAATLKSDKVEYKDVQKVIQQRLNYINEVMPTER